MRQAAAKEKAREAQEKKREADLHRQQELRAERLQNRPGNPFGLRTPTAAELVDHDTQDTPDVALNLHWNVSGRGRGREARLLAEKSDDPDARNQSTFKFKKISSKITGKLTGLF